MRTALSALLILGNVLLFGGCSTRSTEVTPEPSGAGGPTDCLGADTSTDPSNCGTCGHSCLGGGCSNGACQPFVFARGVDRVTNLAMDASAIYAAFWRATPRPLGCSNEAWVSRFDRVTMAETTVVPCTTAAENDLYSMTLGVGALFWNHTVDPSAPTGAGRLTRTDLVTDVSTQFPDANGSHTVAVDDQHAFFWDLDLNLLVRSNLDGSGVAPIGPARIDTVLVDDTNVYYFTPVTCEPNECEDDGTLVALRKDGSPSSTLATGLGVINTAVVHGGFVYWIDRLEGGSDVRRIPVGGGDVQVLASGFALISLAVDDTYAYFIDTNGGTERTSGLWRVPIVGGAKEAIVVSNSVGLAVTVDDTALVWAVEPVSADDPSPGIMMLAK